MNIIFSSRYGSLGEELNTKVLDLCAELIDLSREVQVYAIQKMLGHLQIEPSELENK